MTLRDVMTREPVTVAVSSTLIGLAAGLLWAVGLSTLAYRMEAHRG